MRNITAETSALVLIDNSNNIIAIIDPRTTTSGPIEKIDCAISEHYDSEFGYASEIIFDEKNYRYCFDCKLEVWGNESQETFYLVPTTLY